MVQDCDQTGLPVPKGNTPLVSQCANPLVRGESGVIMRWTWNFNFKGLGPAADTDPKVAFIRTATSGASTPYNSGGGKKSRGPHARRVTLPTLETARNLQKRTRTEGTPDQAQDCARFS